MRIVMGRGNILLLEPPILMMPSIQTVCRTRSGAPLLQRQNHDGVVDASCQWRLSAIPRSGDGAARLSARDLQRIREFTRPGCRKGDRKTPSGLLPPQRAFVAQKRDISDTTGSGRLGGK